MEKVECEMVVHATDAGDRSHCLQHSCFDPSCCVFLLLILCLRLYAAKGTQVVALPLYTHRVPDTLNWSGSYIGLIVGPVSLFGSCLQERIYFIYSFRKVQIKSLEYLFSGETPLLEA